MRIGLMAEHQILTLEMEVRFFHPQLFSAPVAQLEEHPAFNRCVGGSSPSRCMSDIDCICCMQIMAVVQRQHMRL